MSTAAYDYEYRRQLGIFYGDTEFAAWILSTCNDQLLAAMRTNMPDLIGRVAMAARDATVDNWTRDELNIEHGPDAEDAAQKVLDDAMAQAIEHRRAA